MNDRDELADPGQTLSGHVAACCPWRSTVPRRTTVLSRSALLCAVGAACLAVFAAGCGGSSDPTDALRGASATSRSTASVPFEEWADDAQRKCAELNDEFGDVTSADPEDAQAAIAYADGVAEFAAALASAWDTFGVPEGHRSEALDAGGRLDELADAAGDLLSAAESYDPQAASDAVERIGRIGAELNPAMDSLDVPACGGF